MKILLSLVIVALTLLSVINGAPYSSEEMNRFRLSSKHADGSVTTSTDAEISSIMDNLSELNSALFEEAYMSSDKSRKRREIFGSDDRTIKWSTNTCAYSAMGIVAAYYNSTGRTSYCSGFLVSHNVIATAGNCLFNVSKRKFASQVVFYRGASCFSLGQTMYGRTWSVLTSYLRTGNRAKNLGVVLLNESYTDCYFGFGYLSDLENDQNLILLGSAIDRKVRYPCLVETQCTGEMRNLTSYYALRFGEEGTAICHQCDTTPIMGGGPMVANKNLEDQGDAGIFKRKNETYHHSLYAIGIHNSGDVDRAGVGHDDCNWATRITKDMFLTIRTYKYTHFFTGK